jgi:hypothetical protein
MNYLRGFSSKNVEEFFMTINATMYCPLSAEELNFAKAFKLHTKFNEAFQQRKLAEESGCEVAIEEAREAWNAVRALKDENSHLFTSNFWMALNGGQKWKGEEWLAEMEEMRARSGRIANLPPGDFDIDKLANAVKIGMGSRIPMGRFSLHLFDGIIGAFENNVRNPQEAFDNNTGQVRSVYPQALSWLLHAASTANSSLNTSTGLLDEHDLNANVLSLLQKMGVDTSRDFSINGTTFEIRGGAVQTKGYTPARNPNQQFIGAEGMQNLLARAYAQNLFGNGEN